jgi:hypothetical protein
MNGHRRRRRRQGDFSRRKRAGSDLRRRRKLLLEALECRLPLDAGGWLDVETGLSSSAGEAGVWGDIAPWDDVSWDMSPAEVLFEPHVADRVLVKIRNGVTPRLSPQGLRGPATALPPDVGFYPLSHVITAAGAMSAGAVFSQLASENLVMAKASGGSAGTKAESASAMDQSPEDSQAAARADLGRWYRLELPAGSELAATLAVLGDLPEVELAEPVYEWRLSYEIPPVIDGLPDATTDPGYGQQWFHNNAKIWQAWNHLNHNGVYPGGSQDVVVAVIDSGVDYHHEDLAASMWVNPGEIPGNGIDDDGNGFKDDIHGVSVVSNPNMHTGDPIDYHGHGTHVAGIIAAQGFNNKGGVGVAFNTRIMAIRAAQYSGVLTIDDIAEGILYAVDNGADVINMSFGGYARSQIVENALGIGLESGRVGGGGGKRQSAEIDRTAVSGCAAVRVGRRGDHARRRQGGFFELRLRSPGARCVDLQHVAGKPVCRLERHFDGHARGFRHRGLDALVFLAAGYLFVAVPDGRHRRVGRYRGRLHRDDQAARARRAPHNTWLFDSPSIDPANDGDGRADAGETIHIGFELINRSGQADHVIAILDAYAPGATQLDPYVEILSNTVIMRGIGPFATDDNGLIYDAGGVITGVEAPWIVKIKPECPNDHVINFVVTIYFEDGWNPNPEVVMYERMDTFQYIVQRGRNLPPVISQDMTLTADNFWIVGGPVLVEPGATLRIEEGTMVQWGAISSDPYNPGPQTGYIIVRGALRVEGSSEAPVVLFPSYLVSGQTVDIRAESGDARMSYVKVRNPRLTNFYSIDHGYLDWDRASSTVEAWHIRNTALYRFRGGGSLTANYQYDTVLFDGGWLAPSGGAKLTNSVFLQDNENNKPLSYFPALNYDQSWKPRPTSSNLAVAHNGYTYAIMLGGTRHFLQAAELAAEYFGGEVVSVPNQDEENFLASYWTTWLNVDWGARRSQTSLMGLQPLGAGEFQWPDGSPVYFTNWVGGQPSKIKDAAHSEGVWFSCSGYYCTRGWGNGTNISGWYLIRIPGRWTKEEIDAPFQDGRIDAYIEERLKGR